MASTANVSLNVFLAALIILLAKVVRLPSIVINDETKQLLGYPRELLLNFTELTASHGYKSEEHTVVTEDGYILTIFRMGKGKNCRGKTKWPPVILMHGLLQSADAWLDAGPNAGLAYLISDACYDLWVGNVRGNYYSRRHIRLDPDNDSQFWQFSVDEMGLYDVPATIDYVLNKTKADKVNYIGYSQGAGTYFIMCSERPEYCEKSRVLITLAPAARQLNTKSVSYRFLCQSIYTLEYLLSASGVREVFSKGAPSQELLAFICQFSAMSELVCGTGEAIIDSYHPGSISNETQRVLFGHFPAGTSVHNMARYGQSMASEKFAKFDYGRLKNSELYGSAHPPEYNLSAVTVPIIVVYGANDYLVDTKDIDWLLEQLPNVKEAIKVSDPLWNHLDMTYSSMGDELVFPIVNNYLRNYSDG